MGVTKGSDTLYHATHLTRADLGRIIRGQWEERRASKEPGFIMEMPTIDGDSNNICHVVARKSEIKSVAVAEFYKHWSSCGIKVVPIVDGDVRPTCKQATNKRIAERDKNRIRVFLLLKEVNKLKSEIAQGLVGCDALPIVNENIIKLQKESQNKLIQSEDLIPSDFMEALEEALVNDVHARAMNNSGGVVASVLKAKFQADAVIVGRYLNKQSLMALTNDSDIPIVAGDDFIAIKDYVKEGKITIVSTSKATLTKALEFVGNEALERVELKDAACPIFENVKSRKLRALMMVALGCDVYKTGIVGAGPKKLRKILDKLAITIPNSDGVDTEESLFTALLDYTASASGLGISTINTLIKGIIYEPTNYSSYDCHEIAIPASEHTYFDGLVPTKLPMYLSDFAAGDSTMIDEDGPICLECAGVGDRSHIFLESFGSRTCFACNRICCCSCSEMSNEKSYCLQCYAAESMVLSRDADYFTKIAEMRTVLTEQFNYPGAHELPITDVEEVYESCLLSVVNHERLVGGVKYPLYPTSEIEKQSKWSMIHRIHFKDGGTFISNLELKEHVPAMLNFFSSFVRYERKKQTSWVKDPSVYDALPATIINIAQHSRIDSGYRLLARCVRHGHDPKMQSLFCNCADIIKLHDGSIGMVIKMKVPASMKAQVYETTIAITASDLLATECSCRSGSKVDDHVVCVHNLPVAYKVTELLYDGLAEHILLELTSCIASLSEKWTNEVASSVKESVQILMEAAGAVQRGEDMTNMPLDKVLEGFLTGTEKAKAWGQRKLSNSPAQGPIEMLSFESPTKKAKLLKDCNKIIRNRDTENINVSENCASEEFNVNDQEIRPQYLRIALLTAATGRGVVGNQIGFKLLNMRSNTEKNELGLKEIMTLQEDAQKDWEHLNMQAQARSFRNRTNNNLQPRKKHAINKKCDASPRPSKKQRTSKVTAVKVQRASKTRPVPQSQCASTQEKKQVKKKRLTKMPHSYCAREGCCVNNKNSPNTHFHRIPAVPAQLPKNASKLQYIKREGKLLLRAEIADRCHFKRGLMEGAYRICEEHEFETVKKSKQLTWGKDKRGNAITWNQTYDLYVPLGEGPRSTMCLKSRDSRGIGGDRRALKTLEEVSHQIRKGTTKTLVLSVPSAKKKKSTPSCAELNSASLVANAAEARLTLQQMAELGAQEKIAVPITPSVARAAGIQFDTQCSPLVKEPEKHFFHGTARNNKWNKPKKMTANIPPRVAPGVADDEIKRRTGFPTEGAMLSYIFTVCNGEIELVQQRHSSLTWYEEWFFHFEFVWGRTLTRWVDAASECNLGIQPKYLLDIHRHKLQLARRTRDLWPKYASYQEDCCLRKTKWNAKYGEDHGEKRRPVFWDMTGIKAYQFGAADTNGNTYSKYYSGNVFKGGIFTQCCGWMGTHDLWGGNVSDTEYNKSAGYLKEQETYQQNDLIGGELVPFLNIYDKGYRAREVCRRHGQLTAQPSFCKSDKRFSGARTLYSASIASDRGGNERAVLVSKRSGLIKRGFKTGSDAKQFQDAWLTWGFQSNFMFEPVL